MCVCVGGRGGGALPYLAYIVRVFAAEYKVLRIKQGVVFYYFKSKILFFYYYFNSKVRLKASLKVSLWAGSSVHSQYQ